MLRAIADVKSVGIEGRAGDLTGIEESDGLEEPVRDRGGVGEGSEVAGHTGICNVQGRDSSIGIWFRAVQHWLDRCREGRQHDILLQVFAEA